MSPLRNGLNWRWLLVALALALTLLLAAACGDGDEEGAAGEKSPTPTAAGSPAAGKTPSPTNTAAGKTPTAGVSQELKDLTQKWASKSAKVTYEFSTTTETGSMTLYWRLPDYRIDMNFRDQGEMTVLVAGGTSYFCVSGDGEGRCMAGEQQSQGEEGLPFLGEFTDPEKFDAAIAEMVTGLDIDRSTTNIAGEKATCYSASGSIEGQEGEVEWCFSSDGLLLRSVSSAAGTDGGEFRLEATEIGKVSDADFEPPYPVIESLFPTPQ